MNIKLSIESQCFQVADTELWNLVKYQEVVYVPTRLLYEKIIVYSRKHILLDPYYLNPHYNLRLAEVDIKYPIICIKTNSNNTYLADGARRIMSSYTQGLSTIPCQILSVTALVSYLTQDNIGTQVPSPRVSL